MIPLGHLELVREILAHRDVERFATTADSSRLTSLRPLRSWFDDDGEVPSSRSGTRRRRIPRPQAGCGDAEVKRARIPQRTDDRVAVGGRGRSRGRGDRLGDRVVARPARSGTWRKPRRRYAMTIPARRWSGWPCPGAPATRERAPLLRARIAVERGDLAAAVRRLDRGNPDGALRGRPRLLEGADPLRRPAAPAGDDLVHRGLEAASR